MALEGGKINGKQPQSSVLNCTRLKCVEISKRKFCSFRRYTWPYFINCACTYCTCLIVRALIAPVLLCVHLLYLSYCACTYYTCLIVRALIAPVLLCVHLLHLSYFACTYYTCLIVRALIAPVLIVPTYWSCTYYTCTYPAAAASSSCSFT